MLIVPWISFLHFFPDLSTKLDDPQSAFLRFQTNVKLGSFSSATLVLRRNAHVLTKKLLKNHRSLLVRIFGLPGRHLSRAVGHPKILKYNKNWVKLDVTSMLRSKGSHKLMTNLSMEIVCAECGEENGFVNSKKRRPFLIFDVKPVAKMRKRRSSACTQSCCLVRMKVNFASMGYNFIVQPQNFFLNYCKGQCGSYGPTDLFIRRINISNPNNKTDPNDSCCVVKRLMPLSVLYYVGNNPTLIKKDVPNVTAMECECS